MGTVDQIQLPDYDLLTRATPCERMQRTLFASFSASTHKPLAMYELLRLIKRFCSVAGLITGEAG